MPFRATIAALALLSASAAHWTVWAAEPAAGAIAGQDAMGDKGRSGPDGWSWASVARDQGAADVSAVLASIPCS